MVSFQGRASYIYSNCLRKQSRSAFALLERGSHGYRGLHESSPRKLPAGATAAQADSGPKADAEAGKDEGAMSRRLEEMTQEGLESSGLRADKVVQESGFSEELKRKLEARILDSKFRSDHPAAFVAMNMPVSLATRSPYPSSADIQ